MPSKLLILVDGTCVFCNRLVAFILRHDTDRQIHFAHLQGGTASTLLARHGIEADIDTIYAVTDFGGEDERILCDGAAGRQIWPRVFRVAAVLHIVPLALLNLQYRLFARIRYRLFGQSDRCIPPPPEDRRRFHA